MNTAQPAAARAKAQAREASDVHSRPDREQGDGEQEGAHVVDRLQRRRAEHAGARDRDRGDEAEHEGRDPVQPSAAGSGARRP